MPSGLTNLSKVFRTVAAKSFSSVGDILLAVNEWRRHKCLALHHDDGERGAGRLTRRPFRVYLPEHTISGSGHTV